MIFTVSGSKRNLRTSRLACLIGVHLFHSVLFVPGHLLLFMKAFDYPFQIFWLIIMMFFAFLGFGNVFSFLEEGALYMVRCVTAKKVTRPPYWF